jgi:uncharacterized domain
VTGFIKGGYELSAGYETRYKDCDPLITIERIRSILAGLGVLTVEKWEQDIEGYYSLYMEIQGTNLFSNGKGTTPAYALASAYAEMVERLQNLHFAKSNRGISDEARNYLGFCFAPDEKLLSREELRNNDKIWIDSFGNNEPAADVEKDILEKWWSSGYYGDWEKCPCLPFCSITDGKIYYVPASVIANVYWTNGMCAGNTKNEALVQGLSEVVERYVMKRIILDKIVPPTIPEDYIRKDYPYLYGLIKTLEGKGDFKVIVKDCSMGKGFPVAAIVFLDMKRHSYFIRFGAHPVFEIALERCLTELLQGKTINKTDWMAQLSFSEEKIYSYDNMSGLYSDGVGYYPWEILSDKFSYEFAGIKDMKGCGNEKMLIYLIDLLHSKGCNILIRDVSFLGFPAFHVIVPFFSELVDSDLRYFKRLSDLNNAAKVAMKLETASGEELRQVIDSIYENGYGPDASLAALLHKSVASSFPWNNVKRDLFIGSAYYKMGDFKKAYEAMGCFVRDMRSQYNESNNSYYNCVKDYYGALARGMRDITEISNILMGFYPENIVDRVLFNLKEPEGVFINCPRLDCFDCGGCSYTRQCYYPQRERLFMKLKDIYAGNVIDQSLLKIEGM